MASELVMTDTRHGKMLGFAADFWVTGSLVKYGEYNRAEAQALSMLITSGSTVVEVGANIGSHTLDMARKCAPGMLHAFEPQRRVFQVMCANLAINGVGNVVAYPEACGAEEGTAIVPPVSYGEAKNVGGVSLANGGPGEAVKVTTIDALGLSECRLIKVDVEGWECEVIRGAERTIRCLRPLLYVENDRPSRQQELIDLIAGLGYRIYWHLPPLFSPDNFKRDTENVFPNVASINMFCQPAERGSVEGLTEIDPKSWQSPVRRHRKA